MTEIILEYLGLGVIAGTIAGLLGVGGGFVIVPALSFFLSNKGIPEDLIMHLALGTSLATIIFTSLSSSLIHHRKGAVLWDIYRKLLPGTICGTILGTIIADYFSTNALRIFFGLFEIALAIHIFLDHKSVPGVKNPSTSLLSTTGFIIGIISSLLGIGGGSLMVPLLLFFSIPMGAAVGTASAIGLPTALFGTIGYAVAGWNEVTIPGTIGFIYMPAFLGIVSSSIFFAPIGAKIAHKMPVNILKKIFALLLVILGIKILIPSG